MSTLTADPPEANRFDRRRARTRRALVEAAQSLIASGRSGAAISDVTEAADVGIGTFYNHFSSKEELFAVAVGDAVEQFAIALDAYSGDLDDPAEVFARSFRLVGRLHRRAPELSRVVLAQGFTLSGSTVEIWTRARRDLELGVAAGRFAVVDVDLAMSTIAGATLCLGLLLHAEPRRDDEVAVDQVAADLLVLLGLTRGDATRVCARELPSL